MHGEYTLLMSLALDDEADADDLARLAAHLAACADCREVWARWQEMDRRLRAEPLVAAPVGLARRVAVRLGEHEQRRARWLSSGLALGWLALVLLGLLAAVGMFVWLVIHLHQTGALASFATQILTAFNGLLRGVAAVVDSIGMPTLAAVMGGLACLTCGLAMVWLWLIPQGGRFLHVAARHE